MQIPIQISFHGLKPSGALRNAIRERAEKLDRYYAHIVGCRVVLGLAGKHRRKGKQLVARIDLRVPGGEIVINKEHDEDLAVALRDAFDAARRQLEDFGRRQRHPS